MYEGMKRGKKEGKEEGRKKGREEEEGRKSYFELGYIEYNNNILTT